MAFAQSERPASTHMGDMNMTPLIDVLLVLLIMFIITIPLTTHTTDVDVGAGEAGPIVDRVINKVVVTEGGAVLWNGDPVSQADLDTNLLIASRLSPEPELQYEPEANASYALSARTMQTIHASPVTRFGFVGNEKYRKFAAD